MAIKASVKQSVLYKLAKLLSIDNKCVNENDIVKHNRSLILSNNTAMELFVIRYFVEKATINKYYNVNIENFIKVRNEAKVLFE